MPKPTPPPIVTKAPTICAGGYVATTMSAEEWRTAAPSNAYTRSPKPANKYKLYDICPGGDECYAMDWLKSRYLDGIAAVPPMMYGDWSSHGEGCSWFSPQSPHDGGGGLCYELTYDDGPPVTVAVGGRCGGYAQCDISFGPARADSYQSGMATNLPLYEKELINTDANKCLLANAGWRAPSAPTPPPTATSLWVAGSTSECLTGMPPSAKCLPKDQLHSCGDSGTKLCHVDWCASGLHPHFDLNSELLSKMYGTDAGTIGAFTLLKAMPVECPVGTDGKPFPLNGNSTNPHPTIPPACKGQSGADSCTCRNMKPVKLGDDGEYGYVCVANSTEGCNQEPFTNGLASTTHSDMCPTAVGVCENSECVALTAKPGHKTWVEKMYGVKAKKDLINTFPQPTVTEWISCETDACGAGGTACQIGPDLKCEVPGTKVPLGKYCDQPSDCQSWNCCHFNCGNDPQGNPYKNNVCTTQAPACDIQTEGGVCQYNSTNPDPKAKLYALLCPKECNQKGCDKYKMAAGHLKDLCWWNTTHSCDSDGCKVNPNGGLDLSDCATCKPAPKTV